MNSTAEAALGIHSFQPITLSFNIQLNCYQYHQRKKKKKPFCVIEEMSDVLYTLWLTFMQIIRSAHK